MCHQETMLLVQGTLSTHCQHPSVLLRSFSLSPQFVRIFTLLTASTVIQPQTNAAQDSQAALIHSVSSWSCPGTGTGAGCHQRSCASRNQLLMDSCLQEADLGWSSGSGITLNHIPCSVSGREGALREKAHEPLPDLANGYFLHTPLKDSSLSQRICFI